MFAPAARSISRSLVTLLATLAILAALVPGTPLSAEQLRAGHSGQTGFATIDPEHGLRGTEFFAAQDDSEDIRLRTVSYHNAADNLLYFDFDQAVPELLRDRAGRYRIGEANYIYNQDARHGQGAALFNRLENRVVIRSPEELWPGQGPSDDFTIEMWLKPLYFYRENVVFRKLNMLEGRRRGLRIFLAEDRLFVDCENLFEDASGLLHSQRLGARAPLRTGEWVHVAVSYEAARGRVRLFLNGQEENAGQARDTAGVWQMVFHPLDRSPIVLAETYAGALDEFRITSSARRPGDAANTSSFAPLHVNYETLRSSQTQGTVRSAVLRPRGARANSRIGRRARSGRITYRALEPPGTLLNFYVRTSEQPFAADASSRRLPWRRVSAAGVPLDLGKFAYLQWRAELQADPEGLRTPVLRDLTLDYDQVQPPPAPAGLVHIADAIAGSDAAMPGAQSFANPNARRSADMGLVLGWDRSPDPGVQAAGGGYYVYIGLRPGEYQGRLTQGADGQPIRAGGQAAAALQTRAEQRLGQSRPAELRRMMRNRLRIQIDNALIELNARQRPRGPGLPFLFANRIYYFAVSAYDADGAESALSNEVSVRLRPN